MFRIENNTIHCSRGDSGTITLTIPIVDRKNYIKYTDGNTPENIYWYDIENQKLYDNEGIESQISVLTLTEVLVSGIYTLTDDSDDRTVSSYWTTPEDDFNYPQYLKTTNKRGFKSDVTGTNIKIDIEVFMLLFVF